MSWQVSLGLCLYVGWVGLHWWLGQKRLAVPLALLVTAEVLGFGGIWVWIEAQEYDVSAGMAVGLAIMGAAAALLLPAIVGTVALIKHRISAS